MERLKEPTLVMNRGAMRVRRIFLFLIVILVGASFSSALAAEDAAVQFVRFLKENEFTKAYSLLSDDLKSKFSLEKFEREQKEAKEKYVERFGTSRILKAEQLYFLEVSLPKSAREQLQIGDVDISKFFFWRWFMPSKKKRHIFQFIFEGNQKLIFGVDTLKLPRRAVVTHYELLPMLQKMLSSKRPGMYVKKAVVVA